MRNFWRQSARWSLEILAGPEKLAGLETTTGQDQLGDLEKTGEARVKTHEDRQVVRCWVHGWKKKIPKVPTATSQFHFKTMVPNHTADATQQNIFEKCQKLAKRRGDDCSEMLAIIVS